MKLGQSKEDKLRRVTLQIDSSDITFAFKVRTVVLDPLLLEYRQLFCFQVYLLFQSMLQGNRFFQKCLEQPRC
jgi:cell division control protein 6